MSTFRRELQTTDEARKRLASEDPAEPLMVETDIGKVLDEAPPRPPLTVKPGHIHARDAYRAGREDEYIDRMQSRYGGEW